jgi:hypothetical protein
MQVFTRLDQTFATARNRLEVGVAHVVDRCRTFGQVFVRAFEIDHGVIVGWFGKTRQEFRLLE